MKLTSHFSLSGEFRIKIIKAATGFVKRELTFTNLITNIGLDSIGQTLTSSYIFVGTGTTPPSVTDTQLSGYLGFIGIGTRNNISGISPDYVGRSGLSGRSDPGQIVGNITEIAVGWFTSGTNPINHRCFTKTLVKDEAGDPVALTVLADEYFEVWWTCYTHHDLTDVNYTFDVAGVTYTATQRPMGINSVNYYNPTGYVQTANDIIRVGGPTVNLVSITSFPAFNGVSSAKGTAAPYVPGSYSSSTTCTLTPSQGNVAGGIQCIGLAWDINNMRLNFQKQIRLDKPIPKTAMNALTLVNSFSWGRYTP